MVLASRSSRDLSITDFYPASSSVTISQSNEDYLRCPASTNVARPWKPQDCTDGSVHKAARGMCLQPIASRRYSTYNSPTRPRKACPDYPVLALLVWMLAGVQAASALSFDHPSIPAQRLCSTVTFSWSGGVPSFELQIVDATTNAIVEDFHSITGTSFEWVADGQVQGRTVVAKVKDSTGQSAITEHIPVSPGSPDACPQNVVTRLSPPTSSVQVPLSTSTTTAGSRTSTSRTTIATPSTPLPRKTSASWSEPQSPSSSAPDTTSILSTSTTDASSSTIITSPSLSSISPISTSDPSQSPSSAPSTSSSTLTSPPSVTPIPAQSKSPSKAAIVAPIVALLALLIALCAILYWLRRKVAQKRNVVRSGAERADLDLQESCPLLSELAAPERAVIAQRAWVAEEQGTFTPDGEDNVLVIRRPRPRSTDAQASGWHSDFPSSASTTVGYSSFLSTTRSRPSGPTNRRTDSPIDSLVSLFPWGSTRPSSERLPCTHVVSSTRERPLSGTEIDDVLGSVSKLSGPSAGNEGDLERDDLSEMGSMTTLPPPYYHYAV